MNVHSGEANMESQEPVEIITDKKKAIFAHTLELIRDNGFQGTTMSLLIKKAGVAAGTIYHHFDSKDTLIIELHAYIRSKMAAALLAGDNEQQEFKERFFNFCTRQWQFYIAHPEALYFIEQYVNSPYYQRHPDKEHDRCHNLITGLIKTGVEAGRLKPVNYELLGIMVHSSVITTAKVKLKNRLVIGEEELKQVVEILWDGIRNK